MHTVTAALVVACIGLLAWPGALRRRGPLFLAIGALLLVMLVGVVPTFHPVGFGWFIGVFVHFVATVLVAAAFLLLVMSVSGLGLPELMREIVGGLQSVTRSEPHGFPVTPPTGTTPPPATGPQSTGPGGSPPPKI